MGDHLWKQCADWLCRLEVLPANHRIMWPDATIQDLAYTLRDGVLLCHIAMTLDPSSIDPRTVNHRPQMAQFLCLKNIRVFLHACSGGFGIKETDLFQPSMLYDYSDFARVLHTLSRLSHCPKAKSRISGFPAQGGSSNGASIMLATSTSQDEEQIYKTLEELVNDDQYKDFYYRHHGGWGYGRGSQLYATLDQEEVVYEDLCSFKKAGQDQDEHSLPHPPMMSSTLATASSSSTTGGSATLKGFQPKEKRDYCLRELVETESNYVDVLTMLKKYFIRGTMNLKEDDKKIIFMNIQEFSEIHTTFFAEIREALMPSVAAGAVARVIRRRCVAEIFLDYKEKFLLYGQFCATLPKAQQTLDNVISKSEAIRDEIARCEQQANGGRFRLRDLLAVPMQRVLKYHLLLRELLSHTSISHEEYSFVQNAYEAMLDVADYINEVKRDSEQLHIIREIQSSISDWTMPAGMELKDYGRLRKDGELKIQSHDSNAKPKLRYIFVFDRVILLCKNARSGGDHYTYKDSMIVGDYKVQDAPVVGSHQGAFMLVHVENVNAYTLVAKTADEKRKWMTAIGEAWQNVHPARYTHTVMMTTFDHPTVCEFCGKLLKGLFFQGYKCRICEKAMHKPCIGLAAKCGTPSNNKPSLSQRFSSTMSLENNVGATSIVTTPPAPATTSSPRLRSSAWPPSLHTGANPDYINTRLEDQSWFVGVMDRETANQKLAHYPFCTFLVRCRIQGGEKVGHALSLKTETDVKHMKICTAVIPSAAGDATDQPSAGNVCYFLSDSRKFRSVVELVTYFSRHSLKESFSGLDTSLRFPIGELSIVKVLYDYSPAPADRNLLPLTVGDHVTILDRTGEEHGWLKAYNGSRIGYIPKGFVAALDDDSEAVE